MFVPLAIVRNEAYGIPRAFGGTEECANIFEIRLLRSGYVKKIFHLVI